MTSAPIDLWSCNLYPFEATVASRRGFRRLRREYRHRRAGDDPLGRQEPRLCRGRASRRDYARVLAALQATGRDDARAAQPAGRQAPSRAPRPMTPPISDWFAERDRRAMRRPAARSAARCAEAMRYGENPHQGAAFYRRRAPPGVATARQLQGKELSYNNIDDTDAAYELVGGVRSRAAAAVRHHQARQPLRRGRGRDLEEAYRRALRCDPVSAFGGIVAVTGGWTRAAAAEIVQIFTEVVIAPEADEEAVAIFGAKKNLRLLLDRRPARSPRAGPDVPPGRRRLPRAVARQCRRRRHAS